MMMQKEKTVGKAKTVGTLFSGNDLKKLIFPLIIEQILAVSVGMVDTMMVSSAGEAATSGVSLVGHYQCTYHQYFCCCGNGRCSSCFPVSGTEAKR